MKFSVSLYSFFGDLLRGRITPLECVEKAAELGFDAVEAVDFVNFHCEPGQRPDLAKELRQKAESCGLEISSLAVGADFLNGSGGDTAAEIQAVKDWVDIAALLGSSRMRHDITRGLAGAAYRSYESLLPTLADAVRQVADYAQEKGVATMTENHGLFSQDSARVEMLYNAVNHPNFGLLADLGNFLCVDENPALAVGRIAPYVRYVHAKDFIVKSFYEDPGEGASRTRGGNYLRGTIIGHGNVPVKQCLAILKNAGYDGAIAIEFEGLEEPETAVRIGLANLKRYWGEV